MLFAAPCDQQLDLPVGPQRAADLDALPLVVIPETFARPDRAERRLRR